MIAAAALAAWTLGLNVATVHGDNHLEVATPGLYVLHRPSGLAAGVLRNGAGHTDAWLGQTFQNADGRFALTVGAAHVRQSRQGVVQDSCKAAPPQGDPPRAVTGARCRLAVAEVVGGRWAPMVVPSMRMPLPGMPGLDLRVSVVPRAAGRTGVSLSLELPLKGGL